MNEKTEEFREVLKCKQHLVSSWACTAAPGAPTPEFPQYLPSCSTYHLVSHSSRPRSVHTRPGKLSERERTHTGLQTAGVSTGAWCPSLDFPVLPPGHLIGGNQALELLTLQRSPGALPQRCSSSALSGPVQPAGKSGADLVVSQAWPPGQLWQGGGSLQALGGSLALPKGDRKHC